VTGSASGGDGGDAAGSEGSADGAERALTRRGGATRTGRLRTRSEVAAEFSCLRFDTPSATASRFGMYL